MSSEGSPPASPNKARQIVGNYQLGKVIGKGSFGKVRLGTHVVTNQTVAVKILERAKLAQRSDSERIAREIRVLQLLRHEHICNLYEVIETPKELLLVMEYAPGGELFEHIVQLGYLKEAEARRLFGQTVAAVHYCHSNGVVHRDLKPENLLLDDHRNIKLIDYGFANVVAPNELMRTFCGSPAYAPPEMISGQSYVGTLVDVWSLGVILFALLSGYLPFDDDSVTEIYRKILVGKYKFPKHVSEPARDLVQRLLVAEPSQRLALVDVVVHPWMTDGGRVPPVSLASTEQRLEAEPDGATVAEAVALGFEADALVTDLRNGVRNHGTASYFLLRARRRQDAAASASGEAAALAFKPKLSSPLAVAAAVPARARPGALPPLDFSLDAASGPSPSSGPASTTSTASTAIAIGSGSGSSSRRATMHGTASAASSTSSTPVQSPAAFGAASFVPPIALSPFEQLGAVGRRSTAGNIRDPSTGAVAASAPTSSGRAAAIAMAAHHRGLRGDAPPTSAAVAALNRSTMATSAGSISPRAAAEPASLNMSDPSSAVSLLKQRSAQPRKGSVYDVSSAGLSGVGGASAERAAGDEGLRTVKGVFSVSTTSSKEAFEIVAEIERVLAAAKLVVTRTAYRFECETAPDTGEREQVRFELEVCKIPKIALRGLRLKRLAGDTWMYKRLCHSLVSQMAL